jgi:hypothetical protein
VCAEAPNCTINSIGLVRHEFAKPKMKKLRNQHYWTSLESNTSDAWAQELCTSRTNNYYKDTSIHKVQKSLEFALDQDVLVHLRVLLSCMKSLNLPRRVFRVQKKHHDIRDIRHLRKWDDDQYFCECISYQIMIQPRRHFQTNMRCEWALKQDQLWCWCWG